MKTGGQINDGRFDHFYGIVCYIITTDACGWKMIERNETAPLNTVMVQRKKGDNIRKEVLPHAKQKKQVTGTGS
ncbi:hypothetical protein GFC01_12950 [Desulfofundulus thermobenzoicus]|uniref:Uncharacterized protein n=1 Tax=Desulfofundulus thermobenzoicus TaxID=29376 RepID=A0A6N7IUM7_9FIRM|nr:hypothetical protein [Desulfofundulus thermobenzoicus]MQL53147.1 hypothetical protein [Desulfofundulus thermobenzoicus]HHW44851.1 hypothetical protein [Desulfotomaculum sp.]